MCTGLNSCLSFICKSCLNWEKFRPGFLKNDSTEIKKGKLTFGWMQQTRKRVEFMHNEPKKSLIAGFPASYMMLVNTIVIMQSALHMHYMALLESLMFMSCLWYSDINAFVVAGVYGDLSLDCNSNSLAVELLMSDTSFYDHVIVIYLCACMLLGVFRTYLGVPVWLRLIKVKVPIDVYLVLSEVLSVAVCFCPL